VAVLVDTACISLRTIFMTDLISAIAVELAKLGHKVTLSDISSSELEIATEHARKENAPLEDIFQADARDISSVFANREKYDIVLLLGPLYHLLQESERLQALEDCMKLTKPRGFIIVSFVTKFAHLRDVVQKDPSRIYKEREFYNKYLLSGEYTRSQAIVSHHTHPEEIQQLFEKVSKNGLTVQKTLGCEGFLGGGLSKHLNGLTTEEYQAWVDIIMQVAEDPYLLSAADHIVVVAKRD